MGMTVPQTYHRSDSFTLPSTYLIVGLGNVGEQYEQNRHNIGFLSLDHIQTSGYSPWSFKTRLKASMAEQTIDDNKIILAKPHTMMNHSGDAVQAIANFYRIEPENILVIYDDVDIEFGTIRSRRGGGSAGHNGIKSLINHLGEDFARLRIGVANEVLTHQDTADFVLSNFSKDEQSKFDDMFTVVSDTVNQFITDQFSDHSSKI